MCSRSNRPVHIHSFMRRGITYCSRMDHGPRAQADPLPNSGRVHYVPLTIGLTDMTRTE